MQAYLQAFVNYKQNNWARLLPRAKFAYHNVKNARISYTPFELNCGFHRRVSYEEDINPHFRSKTADQLATKL